MRFLKREKYDMPSDLLIAILILSAVACSKNPAEPESEPVFSNFQEEVQYIIESNFPFGGLAVGVIKGDDVYTFFHGTKDKNTDEPPDEDTVYEMGSVTKTFTATLLADFVVKGMVGFSVSSGDRDAHPGDCGQVLRFESRSGRPFIDSFIHWKMR